MREIFDSGDVTEKICLDTVDREINNIYSEYYKENCIHYENCFSDCIGESVIWDRLKEYWGDGRGDYRDRIMEEIIKELKRQGIAKKLAEKDFGAYYKEDIGKILDIS